MFSRYLRDQAETCLRWGRETFDLGTAERLREMAEDFRRKADELETQAPQPAISLGDTNESTADPGAPLDTRSDGA